MTGLMGGEESACWGAPPASILANDCSVSPKPEFHDQRWLASQISWIFDFLLMRSSKSVSLKRVIFALCILGFVYYPANVGIPFPRPPNLALDRTSHADVTSDHFPVPEPTSSLASLPWMQRLPRIKVPVWCRLTFPQAGMWQIAGYAGRRRAGRPRPFRVFIRVCRHRLALHCFALPRLPHLPAALKDEVVICPRSEPRQIFAPARFEIHGLTAFRPPRPQPPRAFVAPGISNAFSAFALSPDAGAAVGSGV